MHVTIADATRIAFGTIEPDECAYTACRALLSALRYYRTPGVHFTRVIIDNGACYKTRAFRRLLRRLGLRHLITPSRMDVHSLLLKAGAVLGASPRAFVLPWSARRQFPVRGTAGAQRDKARGGNFISATDVPH